MAEWSGRKVTAARAVVAGWLAKGPLPCSLCGQDVTLADSWVVGHIRPRATHPELTWRQDNWTADHKSCSDRSGQSVVIEKARAEGRASVFSDTKSSNQSPPLPLLPPRSKRKPLEIRNELTWAEFTRSVPTWLLPVLTVPQDASPPLAMTPVHPEAVDSYGLAVIEWAERDLGIKLRWWQQLAVIRQLEHRLDGSLCWRTVVESAPRRSGKSVRLQVVALSRMGLIEWGETQTVVHTASDMAIAREVQRRSWRWAEDDAEWKVSKSNGKEAIETPEGDRWLIRAQSAVYGYDACLALVDEGWDVSPETVDEGLEPAMLERISPQLVMTSTAHRRATSLMRKRISSALAQDDGETLLLLWGARPQDDPADPETWRKASPHWTDDRARMVASKYAKALAGEDDPELDDPDPMAGFTSQFLNVWQLTEPPAAKGDPLISQESWNELVTELPERPADVVAVESWFSQGVTVARAWSDGVVDAEDYPDLATAAAVVRAEAASSVIVGASLAEDPAWKGIKLTRGQGRTAAAVQDFSRFLVDGINHGGSEHLSEQVVAIRTTPAPDGVRVTSRGRADAVKAATWALAAARKPTKGKPRILVASAR